MLAYYDGTGDERIRDFLVKAYSNYTAVCGCGVGWVKAYSNHTAVCGCGVGWETRVCVEGNVIKGGRRVFVWKEL